MLNDTVQVKTWTRTTFIVILSTSAYFQVFVCFLYFRISTIGSVSQRWRLVDKQEKDKVDKGIIQCKKIGIGYCKLCLWIIVANSDQTVKYFCQSFNGSVVEL